MKRTILLVTLLLFVSLDDAAAGDVGSVAQPDAVLLNLTEAHLNHLLNGALRDNGWPLLSGEKQQVSRGVYDFSYEAAFSEPLLELGENGSAHLSFDIERADLRIGRIERNVASMKLRCDELGARLAPERQVDVDVDLRFAIEDGDLHLAAERIDVSNLKKDFRLIKPERCRHALFPKWFVWWLGKPQLRKRIVKLGRELEGRADELTEDLRRGEALREHWQFADRELFLYPGWLDTGGGSLFLSMALSDTDRGGAGSMAALSIRPDTGKSFVALSESFLNTFLEAAFADVSSPPRKSSGFLAKMVKSDAVYTLLPGLRDVGDRRNVGFSLSLGSPPRIDLVSGSDAAGNGSPTLRLTISDIEVGIWEIDEDGERRLGTLRVDAGRMGLTPYLNTMGGISFALVENEWDVSSEGIEQNTELVAATLQELVFSEIFETRYQPLIRQGIAVGAAGLSPSVVDIADGYLFVELAEY